MNPKYFYFTVHALDSGAKYKLPTFLKKNALATLMLISYINICTYICIHICTKDLDNSRKKM